MGKRKGKVEAVTDFLFLGSKITADVTAAVKLKVTASLQEIYDKSRQCVKSKDITLPTKVHVVKAMVLSVVMYGYTVGQ